MLPRIILYNAVSLDGRTDGFPADIGQFYSLIGRWQEDATLAGSETVLAMESELPEEPAETPARDPNDERALLVIPDSRGRIRRWAGLRATPYWRDVVALVSHSTPPEFLSHLQQQKVDYIVAGEDKVDLRAALEELNARYGVQTVRVDSGGALNGALLRAGLVDEVSLLIHPYLVGGTSPRSMYRAPDLAPGEEAVPLELTHMERLDNGLVWLIYQVKR